MINFDRRIFSTNCHTFARYRDPSDFDRVFNSTLRIASTFREHSNSLVLQGRPVTEHTFRSFALPAATIGGSNRQEEAFNFWESSRDSWKSTHGHRRIAGSRRKSGRRCTPLAETISGHRDDSRRFPWIPGNFRIQAENVFQRWRLTNGSPHWPGDRRYVQVGKFTPKLASRARSWWPPR